MWNPYYWFPVLRLSPAASFNAEVRARHCSDKFAKQWWKVNLINNSGCPSSVCQSQSSNFSDSRTKFNMSSHKWYKGHLGQQLTCSVGGNSQALFIWEYSSTGLYILDSFLLVFSDTVQYLRIEYWVQHLYKILEMSTAGPSLLWSNFHRSSWSFKPLVSNLSVSVPLMGMLSCHTAINDVAVPLCCESSP